MKIDSVFVFFHGNGYLQFLLCHVDFAFQHIKGAFEALEGSFLLETEVGTPEFCAFGQIVGSESVCGVAAAKNLKIIGGLLYFEDSVSESIKGIGVVFVG